MVICENEKRRLLLTLKTYEAGLNAVQNLDKLFLINSTLLDLNNDAVLDFQFSVEDTNQPLCLQSIEKRQCHFCIHQRRSSFSALHGTNSVSKGPFIHSTLMLEKLLRMGQDD